ncbi:ATP synthase F0 [Colletotrichum scovillei]|uniref:ATP synthase F0 n=1 Tax=Colletotrichum scovillei TaxID=1209932 RepID=UPI0015C39E21|nr:ATP synthase F0 [Colletotrichum scovillei]KAF4773678.1 ATP synthase F0 [Colletotrichum scovillei]
MLPPKRFPFPLQLGTDLCQISRIYRILASDKESSFLRRILTQDERLAIPAHLKSADASATPSEIPKDDDFQALKKRNPLLWKKASFLAGRFAAKEATFKAHPTRNLTWHDITIVRKQSAQLKDIEGQRKAKETEPPASTPNGSGPPIAIVRSLHEGMPGQEVLVSISHDGDYATAVCLAFEAQGDGYPSRKQPEEREESKKRGGSRDAEAEKEEKSARAAEAAVEVKMSYEEFEEFKAWRAWKAEAEEQRKKNREK